MENYLAVIGITLTFLGALSIARGLFISKKEALKLGLSRWASNSDEENYKLPAVKDRLEQRKYGIIGAILLSTGFIFQLVGQFQ